MFAHHRKIHRLILLSATSISVCSFLNNLSKIISLNLRAEIAEEDLERSANSDVIETVSSRVTLARAVDTFMEVCWKSRFSGMAVAFEFIHVDPFVLFSLWDCAIDQWNHEK